MMLRDFVSRLEGQGQVILSDGITLRAAALEGLTPRVLAETLTSFLPLDSEIHSGWHTKMFGLDEKSQPDEGCRRTPGAHHRTTSPPSLPSTSRAVSWILG